MELRRYFWSFLFAVSSTSACACSIDVDFKHTPKTPDELSKMSLLVVTASIVRTVDAVGASSIPQSEQNFYYLYLKPISWSKGRVDPPLVVLNSFGTNCDPVFGHVRPREGIWTFYIASRNDRLWILESRPVAND